MRTTDLSSCVLYNRLCWLPSSRESSTGIPIEFPIVLRRARAELDLEFASLYSVVHADHWSEANTTISQQTEFEATVLSRTLLTNEQREQMRISNNSRCTFRVMPPRFTGYLDKLPKTSPGPQTGGPSARRHVHWGYFAQAPSTRKFITDPFSTWRLSLHPMIMVLHLGLHKQNYCKQPCFLGICKNFARTRSLGTQIQCWRSLTTFCTDNL